MNKKPFVLFLASTLAVGALHANDFSLSADVTFSSEKVFRGVKDAGPTIVPSVEVFSVGNPGGEFYLGARAATPARSDFENEINAFAGFDAELQHNFFVDVGAVYYHFPETGFGAGLDDTIEPYLGLRMQEIADTPLSAGGYFYYDIDKSFTVESFLEYSMPFQGGIPATLDLGAFLGFTDEDRRFEEDHAYYGLYAVVPYEFNSATTFTAGVHYAARNGLDNAPIEDDRDFLYWTAGLKIRY